MKYPELLILILTVSVQTIPISNKISQEKLSDPEKIFYPDDIIHKAPLPTIRQQDETTEAFCLDRALNGILLAADVDQSNVTCYEVGSQGPCHSNMKFYKIPGKSDVGMCDCDQEVQGIAYSNETKECHHLYRREYCKEGHWLELTQEGLNCTINSCVENGTTPALDVVTLDGKCVTLYGSCNSTVGTIGHIGFDSSNEIKCLPGDTNYSITKSIPQLKCSEGTRWSTLTNTCRKAIKFDFS